jgi:hypothetical protein
MGMTDDARDHFCCGEQGVDDHSNKRYAETALEAGR